MKKTKHLIVRITPEQLKKLTIHLQKDNITKSELLRGLLDFYLNNFKSKQ